MMKDHLLVSTSMLNAYWERQQKDTFALIQPFIEYVIGKTTAVGNFVDLQAVHRAMDEEFGYSEMPLSIIERIMARMTTTVLEKRAKKYYLRASLEDKMRLFEDNRVRFKERKEAVGKAFLSYLNECGSSSISLDEALNAFTGFLERYGVRFVRNSGSLSMVRKSEGGLHYQVARFILSERDKKSVVFDYVVDMVNGFFLATAVYLQPERPGDVKAKLKNLNIYIDTGILLSALGFNEKEQEASAVQLIEMAKKQGGNVACFRITVEEVRRILRAYQRSLMQEGGRQDRHTLSGLDSLRCTHQGVERILLSLDAKIHALGVDIVEPVNLEANELACRWYEELVPFLKCEISYSTESAPRHDAHCVTSIYIQRDGAKSTDIEKCRSLFITPNSLLARLAKIPNNEKESDYVPLSMLDGDFASIVWLKCYGTHRDYPKIKLMEDVSLATLPSDDIIEAFLDNVDEYEKQGGLTAEAAAALRAGYYNKRALMGSIEGDLNRISFDTVREMEVQVRAGIALQEIEKRRDAEQKLAINERKTDELVKGVYDEIEKAGIEAGSRARKRFTVLAWVAFVAISLISLVGVFMDTIEGSAPTFVGVVLFVLGLIGIYDLVKSREGWVKRVINRVSDNYAEKAREEKRKDLSSILDRLNS